MSGDFRCPQGETTLGQPCKATKRRRLPALAHEVGLSGYRRRTALKHQICQLSSGSAGARILLFHTGNIAFFLLFTSAVNGSVAPVWPGGGGA